MILLTNSDSSVAESNPLRTYDGLSLFSSFCIIPLDGIILENKEGHSSLVCRTKESSFSWNLDSVQYFPRFF